MSKKKSTRRALFTSALAILLCISMLMGSTFAWFTDGANSGGNIIQSGTLDLQMYWTDDLSSGNWYNVEDDAYNTIFSYDKWEPGYTDVKYIKLVNNGNLALNYQLALTPQGSVGKLAEVINVLFADSAVDISTREDLSKLGSIGFLSNVMNGNATAAGTLLPAGTVGEHPAGEVIVTMAMSMITTAGNEYQDETSGAFTITALATQATYEKDSFGNTYDQGAEFPQILTAGQASVQVTPEDGKVPVGGVTMTDGNIAAFVPGGAKLENGANKLTLKITPLEDTTSDITVVNNEILIPVDVHIEGLAADNSVPAVIDLGEVLPKYLNMGNYRLIHVENGTNAEMSLVDSRDALTAHNSFTYDPLTGAVSVAMASFSEVALVADTTNAWEGKFDYSWYTNAVAPVDGESTSEYIIANADQLAAFGAIVGGMNGQTQDSFAGKTVKLISDINLGDSESENNPNIIFYPIGYYNSEGTYERTNTAITSGLRNFEGTFDGQGHAIANFYQNTWEMKGDHDWYSPEEQYYRDGMGLFGKVYGGTVKNLTVNNFKSDGEIATTGCVAAYAEGATFENIAITNCNPRVYNIGNGGIVGCVGWYAKEANLKTSFKNITVDNTNKISALWGSYDVACGGIVGQYYPTSGQTDSHKNAGIDLINCHVSAQMDVYNDVCGNYQYYAYRYAGMIIGSIRENTTTVINGVTKTIPNMTGISATGCTVNYGDWNDYYYCEFEKNGHPSYSGPDDYKFSRVPHSELDFTDSNGNGLVDADERASVTGCKHNHTAAEDNKAIYLPFHQLFTGYGWGVNSIGLEKYSGIVTDQGITEGDQQESVVKFVGKDVEEIANNFEIQVGTLFSFVDNGVKLAPDALNVTVTDLDDADGIASGVFVLNADNWESSTLTISGTGRIRITIQDYYFCTPVSIEVTVTERTPAEKFETKFTGNFLYRVGNQNTVYIGSLFAAIEGATISNSGVVVSVVKLDENSNVSGTFTANTTDWTKGTIKFSGTGVVKIAIQDYNFCKPTELLLEVVDAKNYPSTQSTSLSATANNVVLLQNVSGSFTVSNGNTFYGNGFTVTLPTNSVQEKGQGFTGYVSIGAAQDSGAATGGNLDNVRIVGPEYPEMYLYRSQAEITDKTDPDYGEGSNMRYFRNSVIVYGGNCTISNSYISGCRTPVCLRGGNNVVIENTTLSGGSVANMQVAGVSSLVLRDLTTDGSLGIYVDSSAARIFVEGQLNQYNWTTKSEWEAAIGSANTKFFPSFFTDSAYKAFQHERNGEIYVNMAFIFACDWDSNNLDVTNQSNNTAYQKQDKINVTTPNGTVSGGVYTVANQTLTDDLYNAPEHNVDTYNPITPTLTFDNTPNDDADDANDANDTYCVYNESAGTLKIGISGDTKTIDLSKVVVAKNGNTLVHTAYLNGVVISGDSVVIKAADGAKQTLTFKATSNDAGYDKDGNPIAGSIDYTWSVTVEIAVLSYPAPEWNMGGNYQFSANDNCVYAYYGTSNGYGEAVPIYEGIKIKYYDKNGTPVELDLSGTTTHPTGSGNSNSNAFTYTLADGSTLTMKFVSGWKSGATTHQFTTYNKNGNKVYIYPQSLDNDNYIRAKIANQDFDVKISYNFTDPNGQSITQTMRWYSAKGSSAGQNGKISTVQWQTFDSVNGKKAPTCVTPDTLVTLADGTQVRIDALTGNEELLVWNHETGKLDKAPVAYIVDHNGIMEEREIIHLNFANGKTVKMIEEHVFFDATLNKYVAIDSENVESFVGHTFVAIDETGNAIENVKLVSIEREVKETLVYEVVSYKHLTCFTEGVLSTSAFLDPLLNVFDVNANTLAYSIKAVRKDIETYGLYTYADFEGLISEEAFELYNAQYLKIAVGKGYITWDDILDLIDIYFNVNVQPIQ